MGPFMIFVVFRCILGSAWVQQPMRPGRFLLSYLNQEHRRHWMGVFRNLNVIPFYTGRPRKDGTPHRHCVSGEGSPEPNSDDIEKVLENHEWEATSRDIVVVVSHGVKQVLTSEQIFASMKTFEESGLDEYIPGNSGEDGLRAIGIVKAAQVASNGPPAMVVKI